MRVGAQSPGPNLDETFLGFRSLYMIAPLAMTSILRGRLY